MSTSLSTYFDPPNVQNLNIPDEQAVFGIDLGTIQTRVVIMDHHEDNSHEYEPKLIANIPSVVSYTKNAKCLVGSCAAERIVTSPSNTFHSTKSLMSRNYDDPFVQQFAKTVNYDILRLPDGQACLMSSNFNQILTPGDIVVLILLKVKEICRIEFEKSMKNVVITTPAHFTENQIKCTREAAQMAGLNVLKMINEPTAAIFAYGLNETADKTVVVYDFGGTFKVSVLKIRNGAPEIKSTVHDPFLGCNDFDNVLVKYFVENLKNKVGFDVSEDVITMKWLKSTAQNSQTDLCYYTELNIFFYHIRFPGKPDRISIKLTRSKYEELVTEFINKTIPLCHKALKDAKVAVSDIDEVIAIGGVSRIPKVRATVQEIFNKAPQSNQDRDDRRNCVAIGAATIGKILSSNITEDNATSARSPPQFLKPCKETDVFNYRDADDLNLEDVRDKMYENVVAAGFLAVFTDEEADHLIVRNRTSKGLMDDEDVNFLLAYQQLIEARRCIPEKELSEEIQTTMGKFRKKRDDFVFEELCRTYTMKE